MTALFHHRSLVSVTRTQPHKQTRAPRRQPRRAGSTSAAEGVEEGCLVLPDVVQVEVVEPDGRELGEPVAVPRQVVRHLHRAADGLEVDVLGHHVEALLGLGVPVDRLGEDVAAPLVEGDGVRLLGRRCPRQVHLQRQRTATARVAVGRHDVAEHLDRLVDRDEPVRPRARPGRRRPRTPPGRSSRGGTAGRSHSRARSTVTSPSWLTSSPSRSRRMTDTHSSRRRVRTSLRGQPVAGDVLVAGLAAAERDPEPAGEHLGRAWRSSGPPRPGGSAGRAR